MKSTLIKNGLVCFEDGIRQSDIYIENRKISSFNLQSNADEIIDAKGFYVLPGMIDIHTHLDDVIGKYELADTYKSGSEIAVLNGITTLFTFITQRKDESLKQGIEKAKEKVEGNSFCDYIWHLTPTSFDENNWKEIFECIEKGFKTFKFYTTYEKAGIYSSNKKLEKIFEKLKRYDLTFLVHCEDNDTIKKALNKKIAEAVIRVREAKVKLFPGYDGEYGKIQIFARHNNIDVKSQLEMF